jgi:signal transduction histidine kinase
MSGRAEGDDAQAHAKRRFFGLSGKLMVLTIGFVMLAEVLIYIPSMANFRNNWLRDKLASARIAALVLEAAPAEAIPEALITQLLDTVGARMIAMRIEGSRRLLAVSDMPVEVARDYDLRLAGPYASALASFDTLLRGGDRLVRVIGPAPMGGEFIELIINERPLVEAMWRFSANILGLSLIISSITAALVYASLHWLIVRPVKRLADSTLSFSENTEDATRFITPSSRRDEIGDAERAFAQMQTELSRQFKQQQHLAAMGLSVAKINHDLRNMLASAQLLSDRLGAVQDPAVQRLAPKLIGALDRAIGFCKATLAFGKAQERPPSPRTVDLAALVDELGDLLGLGEDSDIRLVRDMHSPMRVTADPEHLMRVLLNIARNAVDAMRQAGTSAERPGLLIISARHGKNQVEIDISDSGPGIPPELRSKLFQAFSGAARGGTGLGLAIALELMRAQGGNLALVESQEGARFRATLPT